MCELFGMSCNSQDRAINILEKFKNYSYAARDGWGVGYYDDDGNAKWATSDVEYDAKYDDKFRETIKNAKSNIIIAHLRKATNGKKCKKNCHPFIQVSNGRYWIFAHNGKINGIDIPDEKTDSECAFELIINNIIKCTPSQEIGINMGVYHGIIKGIQYIFNEYGRKSNLNFLMSDGSFLYAFHHHDNEDKKMYFVERSKKIDDVNALLVSNRKELFKGEECKKMPTDQLLVICNAEILISSEKLLPEKLVV